MIIVWIDFANLHILQNSQVITMIIIYRSAIIRLYKNIC